MNPQNRPGPLNEHDYYITRENTDSQQYESSQQEVHIDGLQVCSFLFFPQENQQELT